MPNLKIFASNANPDLARAVARYLDAQIGKAEVGTFSDGEIAVEIHENVAASTASSCSRPARPPTRTSWRC